LFGVLPIGPPLASTRVAGRHHAVRSPGHRIHRGRRERPGDRPGIAIDEIHDGNTRDCLNVTLDGARHLVAVLTALIDEVDGWVSSPS